VSDDRTVIDFDHHSREHAADLVGQYAKIRRTCPVAWSEHHGGYWVVSGYDEATAVLRDAETFSSVKVVHPDGSAEGGVTIPPLPNYPRNLPAEVDPPLWNEYRRMLARPFSHSAVQQLRPKLRDVATAFVDRIIEKGSCDLIDDLANPYPATNILLIMGLPLVDWEFYARPFHAIVSYPEGSPELAEAGERMGRLVERLRAELAARRAKPAEDVLSDIANGTVGGKPIDEEEAMNAALNLVGAGLDTTTSFLGLAFAHLSAHPEDKERLRADPSLIPLAVEEFMRFNSPVQALARTVATPTELGGERLSAGERVLVAYASANRDERVFDAPDQFRLDRTPNPHLGFGAGIHKCIGQHLARTEIEVLLDEVLRRMPDFEVDESALEKYDSLGIVNGYKNMPASFTPGPVIGSTVRIQ
jgi:cytochrome P450